MKLALPKVGDLWIDTAYNHTEEILGVREGARPVYDRWFKTDGFGHNFFMDTIYKVMVEWGYKRVK